MDSRAAETNAHFSTNGSGPAPSSSAPTSGTPGTLDSGIATDYWDELRAGPGRGSSLWLSIDGMWRRLENPTVCERLVAVVAFSSPGLVMRAWYAGRDIVNLVVTDQA